MKILLKACLAAAALFAVGQASAIPKLQLGILGATYNAATETSVAGSTTFTLFAFLTPGKQETDSSLAADYFISASVAPQVNVPGASLGSFTFGADNVNVTSGMTYGTPPLEAILALQAQDPGDLPGHGIFPTYFKEFGFNFDKEKQVGKMDVTSSTASLSTLDYSGKGMYYQTFEVSVAGLLPTHSIHFDLYSSLICQNGQGQCNQASDVDVDEFAPFSHDAQSGNGGCTSNCGGGGGGGPGVPEPASFALAIAALAGLRFAKLRRQRAAS